MQAVPRQNECRSDSGAICSHRNNRSFRFRQTIRALRYFSGKHIDKIYSTGPVPANTNMSRFADGPDQLTLIPIPHDASIRRHNPPARGSDSQIPADSGHHPRRSPAAQQAEDSLPAGTYHRRCGDRTARPQPGVARQQHHPLRYGRTALHHVPLRPGYGHVGFPQERHPKPRIRTLYVLCSAPARYSGGILHPGIFDLLLDPAGRTLRLADPDRLPHRQQTGPSEARSLPIRWPCCC